MRVLTLSDFHCVCVSGPLQNVRGPRDVIYFPKAITNSFRTSISKVYFFLVWRRWETNNSFSCISRRPLSLELILSKAQNCAKSLGSNRGWQILFGNRKNRPTEHFPLVRKVSGKRTKSPEYGKCPRGFVVYPISVFKVFWLFAVSRHFTYSKNLVVSPVSRHFWTFVLMLDQVPSVVWSKLSSFFRLANEYDGS